MLHNYDFKSSRRVREILGRVEKLYHLDKKRVHLYKSEFDELLAALPEQSHDEYYDGIPYEGGLILRV